MQPIVTTKQLTAAAATNICLSQTPGAASNLTLNGALVASGVATLDTGRRVGITSAGNDSARTFTVYGTMESGVVITEAVTGANIGVASTLQDYKTVTRIAVDAATAGAVTVGTTAVGSTPWFIMNPYLAPFSVGCSLEILTGTATATVEVTDDSPLVPIPVYLAGGLSTQPVPTARAAINGLDHQQTLSRGLLSGPSAAIRLTINTGTGKAQMTARQPGIVGP